MTISRQRQFGMRTRMSAKGPHVASVTHGDDTVEEVGFGDDVFFHGPSGRSLRWGVGNDDARPFLREGRTGFNFPNRRDVL